MTTEGLTKISYILVNFGSDKKSRGRKANTVVSCISMGIKPRRDLSFLQFFQGFALYQKTNTTSPNSTITLILFVSHSEKGNLIPSWLVLAMLLGQKFLKISIAQSRK